MSWISRPKGSKVWHYFWWDKSTGKQHQCSLKTESRREAVRLQTQRDYEIINQTARSADRLFSDFARGYSDWFDNEYPSSWERSRQITEQYLIPFFGDYFLGEIDVVMVESYKQTRKVAGAKAATIKKELQKLNAILNTAVKWNTLSRNQLSGHINYPQLLDSKPPRYYTKDELNALYANSPNHWYWWKFLANTGLRRGEILPLHTDTVSVSERYIRVLSSEQSRTKSAKWRQIPLNDAALEALNHFDIQEGLIFPRVHIDSISRALVTDAKRAGITPVGSLHCLRHTFCSHLVMAGVPLRTVQVLAGHSRIEVTEKYAHLAPGHLEDSTRKIDL